MNLGQTTRAAAAVKNLGDLNAFILISAVTLIPPSAGGRVHAHLAALAAAAALKG